MLVATVVEGILIFLLVGVEVLFTARYSAKSFVYANWYLLEDVGRVVRLYVHVKWLVIWFSVRSVSFSV